MSGMPPPPPFSGTSATMASVVRMFVAMDAAFCSGARDRTAARAERDLDRVCDRVHARLERGPRLRVVLQLRVVPCVSQTRSADRPVAPGSSRPPVRFWSVRQRHIAGRSAAAERKRDALRRRPTLLRRAAAEHRAPCATWPLPSRRRRTARSGGERRVGAPRRAGRPRPGVSSRRRRCWRRRSCESECGAP
jgi:hypothetical protein